MGLPLPINWITPQQGSCDWLFYQKICNICNDFDSCQTLDEFTSLFHQSIVDFEVQYPSLTDANSVSTVKLKVYQQIMSQLPLEIGNQEYEFADFEECNFLPKKINIDQSVAELVMDDSFPTHIWNALSLGLKICNHQDKGLAAMRETMSLEWIQAQEKTPMVLHKNALVKLTSHLAGKHGYSGLGDLFG